MAMVDKDTLLRLTRAFPRSFINGGLEFIAHRFSNAYFRLEDCETELDVKCKVLEWLSRTAYKAQPYSSEAQNRTLHVFMRNCINEFLHTSFTEEDIALIYQRLGNRVRHDLTVAFAESGYDMKLLEGGTDNA